MKTNYYINWNENNVSASNGWSWNLLFNMKINDSQSLTFRSDNAIILLECIMTQLYSLFAQSHNDSHRKIHGITWNPSCFYRKTFNPFEIWAEKKNLLNKYLREEKKIANILAHYLIFINIFQLENIISSALILESNWKQTAIDLRWDFELQMSTEIRCSVGLKLKLFYYFESK